MQRRSGDRCVRAIKASGVQPERSIRFALFTGEEQGTLGSLAYVRKHREEMDKIVGVLIFDEGTGRVTGFSLGGRQDILAPVARLVAPFKTWGATKLTTDAFVGTDNLDFLLEGVPNLVANQVEANYLENYHASSDTYDKVDFDELKKHVAIAATLMYEFANSPRVGPRQDHAQVDALVKATRLDDQLKSFGMWSAYEQGARGRVALSDNRNMQTHWTFWLGFNLFVLVMLALDLGVFHRKSHQVRFKEALLWSAFWIALALAFAVLVLFWQGRQPALEFITGYVVEESLSVDNLFVFLVLFRYFKVEPEYQHKVLFWGIIGALITRGIFIVAGVGLINRFHWIIYIFGVFLIFKGITMWRSEESDIEPEKNFFLRLLRRFIPVTDQYEGGKFFVRQDAKRYATPLFIVLLVVEFTDVAFATDSLPRHSCHHEKRIHRLYIERFRDPRPASRSSRSPGSWTPSTGCITAFRLC